MEDCLYQFQSCGKNTVGGQTSGLGGDGVVEWGAGVNGVSCRKPAGIEIQSTDYGDGTQRHCLETYTDPDILCDLQEVSQPL